MSGFAWVTWRQQRWLVLAALATVGGFLLAAGLEHLHIWFPGASLSRTLAAFLPAAVGVFWGAPLLARQLESGSAELAWTQTVPRLRWLAAALAVVVVATGGVALAVLAILPTTLGSRFSLLFTYDVQSAAAVGYALFAVALGVFVGAVIGRVELAMGVTLVGYSLVRAVVGTVVRHHLPLHRIVLSHRAELGRFESHAVIRDVGAGNQDVLVTYQPASQFAKLQWLELGLYAGLAAVLLAATFVVIARRGARS
jgi:hypothetical protein